MGGDGVEGKAPNLPYAMILFNGEALVDSPLSDAILLGDGVFETLRSYEGRLFALDAHLERLEKGLLEIGVREPCDRSLVYAGIRRVLDGDEFRYGSLRISIYADGNWVVSHKEYHPPVEALRCTFLDHESSNLSYKRSSYSSRLQIRRMAQSAGYDDAILVSSDGEISELSTANLLALIDSHWVTPRIESGALPGITRRMLIENFGVREVRLTKPMALEADAMVAISSLREVQGIKEIAGKDTPISNRVRELQESFHSWILGNLSL